MEKSANEISKPLCGIVGTSNLNLIGTMLDSYPTVSLHLADYAPIQHTS